MVEKFPNFIHTHLNQFLVHSQSPTVFTNSNVFVLTLIGQTCRTLKKRAQEHQQSSKSLGILEHINNCETYKSRKKLYLTEYKNLPLPLKITEFQKENEFYKSHYSILQKNFRNVYDRLRSEAYYIRMFRPKLNIQTNTRKYFRLF